MDNLTTRVLSAIKAAASWPNCTAQDVAEAAVAETLNAVEETIRIHALADGWPLSQRNALLHSIRIADC